MTWSFLRRAAAGGLGLLALAVPAGAATIEIPYTKYVLPNGLTLLVSEDHKAPIVAVNVWYHVGSKNEKLGKTGFAHLFEHLMFNGSENFNDDYFKPFDRVGATDMNGTTNFDRTNYFQNVPKTALDMALWMESDRMGHLLGAIDQARLDEQVGVVQNEKRQGENQPYGKSWITIFENTYPKGHPYSWSVIGSLEDLKAASLEDVKDWFRSYYGAANATLVVAGDVEADAVKEKVEAYFGDIPSGPPVARQEAWVSKRTGTQRLAFEDRVPQARIYKVWNVPQWGTADLDYLSLAADFLASGKSSRLYRRLVMDDQIATDVSGFVYERELGSLFFLWATAQPGQDLAEVEKALDEELQRFMKTGPTRDELERVQMDSRAGFIRGVERIGGFGGKSDILAQCQVYAGDPDFYRTSIDRKMQANVRDVQNTARRWLDDGQLVLEVRPFPEYTTVTSRIDRSKIPATSEWPEVAFPAMERRTLANGLEVILVPRDTAPLVNLNLLLDAGYASDQFSQAGTASLAMNLLDEGTKTRNNLEISDELDLLGASLNAGSNLDQSSVTLSALAENLDPSLKIFADVILNPSFPEAEFTRLKKEQVAAIGREQVSPETMALRVFPQLVYGKGHAYGTPFTGSGTEASVAAITRDDLVEFHQTWFRPNHAKMVVVGATTMDAIAPRLEKLFAAWKPGDVPVKNLAQVGEAASPAIYLVDRPGSIQSVIIAGHIVPPTNNPDEIAIEAMRGVLGSGFNARINMNLREDKHWSYGAGLMIAEAAGERPLMVFAPVQTDKTAESMVEIEKELRDIVGKRPPEAEELARVKDKNTLSLPGRWETLNAVMNDASKVVRFGFPEDHWNTYPKRVRDLSLAKVAATARAVIHPDRTIWVVVGDRQVIEPKIRELGMGEVIPIDADGTPTGSAALKSE